jgi:hypothetical protein
MPHTLLAADIMKLNYPASVPVAGLYVARTVDPAIIGTTTPSSAFGGEVLFAVTPGGRLIVT